MEAAADAILDRRSRPPTPTRSLRGIAAPHATLPRLWTATITGLERALFPWQTT